METTERAYGEGGRYGESGSPVTEGSGEVNVGSLERWGSVALGAAFTLMAFRRGGAMGSLLMLSAGGLLMRGITGHCHAYGALGIDTSKGGEVWSPERSDYSSGGSGYGSRETGWPASGAERSDTSGERSGAGAGGGQDREDGGVGREGGGTAQVRSFELHASDEGIHGTGTDRTEPYPRG